MLQSALCQTYWTIGSALSASMRALSRDASGCFKRPKSSIASACGLRSALRSARPEMPCASNCCSAARSIGSNWSNSRVVSKPREEGRLTCGPDIGQTLQRVLLHLQTEVVAGRTGLDARRAANRPR
jgi:hypothetical protein